MKSASQRIFSRKFKQQTIHLVKNPYYMKKREKKLIPWFELKIYIAPITYKRKYTTQYIRNKDWKQRIFKKLFDVIEVKPIKSNCNNSTHVMLKLALRPGDKLFNEKIFLFYNICSLNYGTDPLRFAAFGYKSLKHCYWPKKIKVQVSLSTSKFNSWSKRQQNSAAAISYHKRTQVKVTN